MEQFFKKYKINDIENYIHPSDPKKEEKMALLDLYKNNPMRRELEEKIKSSHDIGTIFKAYADLALGKIPVTRFRSQNIPVMCLYIKTIYI